MLTTYHQMSTVLHGQNTLLKWEAETQERLRKRGVIEPNLGT